MIPPRNDTLLTGARRVALGIALVLVVVLAGSVLWPSATGTVDAVACQPVSAGASPMTAGSPSASPMSYRAAEVLMAGPIRGGGVTTGVWALTPSGLMVSPDPETWTRVPPPSDLDLASASPGVDVVDPEHAWLATASTTTGIALWATDNGGHSWQEMTLPGPAFMNPPRLAFADRLHGSIFGRTRVGDTLLFATSDGGVRWESHAIAIALAWDLIPSDGSTIWAWRRGASDMCVDCNQPLLQVSRDSGRTWSPASLPGVDRNVNPSTGIPSAPTFFDARRGLIAVNRGVEGEPGAAISQVFGTPDGGRHWTPMGQPFLASLGTIAFVDESHWIGETGDPPRLLSTHDAGATCTAIPLPSDPTIFELWFVSAGRGYALAYSRQSGVPMMLVTVDGGRDWEPANFGALDSQGER